MNQNSQERRDAILGTLPNDPNGLTSSQIAQHLRYVRGDRGFKTLFPGGLPQFHNTIGTLRTAGIITATPAGAQGRAFRYTLTGTPAVTATTTSDGNEVSHPALVAQTETMNTILPGADIICSILNRLAQTPGDALLRKLGKVVLDELDTLEEIGSLRELTELTERRVERVS
jgi:hypothetical protein